MRLHLRRVHLDRIGSASVDRADHPHMAAAALYLDPAFPVLVTGHRILTVGAVPGKWLPGFKFFRVFRQSYHTPFFKSLITLHATP